MRALRPVRPKPARRVIPLRNDPRDSGMARLRRSPDYRRLLWSWKAFAWTADADRKGK